MVLVGVSVKSFSAPAEAARAVAVLEQRLLEAGLREVEGHSSSLNTSSEVGRLLQKVVGEPLLAARADDDLGVVHVRLALQGGEVRLAQPSKLLASTISAHPP